MRSWGGSSIPTQNTRREKYRHSIEKKENISAHHPASDQTAYLPNYRIQQCFHLFQALNYRAYPNNDNTLKLPWIILFPDVCFVFFALVIGQKLKKCNAPL